jgi:hypothetical protein
MAAKHFHLSEPHRQGAQLALDQPARLRPNDWSSLEIRVLDLSSTYFRAECEARLPKGSLVSLELPGLGEVLARVEWQQGKELGATFTQPIEIDRCTWPALAHNALADASNDDADARAFRGES